MFCYGLLHLLQDPEVYQLLSEAFRLSRLCVASPVLDQLFQYSPLTVLRGNTEMIAGGASLAPSL